MPVNLFGDMCFSDQNQGEVSIDAKSRLAMWKIGKLSPQTPMKGAQTVFTKQPLAGRLRGDLLEDKGIELVGSNVALWAALVLPSSSEGIVIAAVVVVVEGAVAPAHLMTRHAHRRLATAPG